MAPLSMSKSSKGGMAVDLMSTDAGYASMPSSAAFVPETESYSVRNDTISREQTERLVQKVMNRNKK